MDIEESKILLKDFQKGKIEKDKLEHYRGSYKMGYFYTVDIQEALETVLSELEKKEVIINEMAKYMEQEMAEYQLDDIYSELHNCNGMERNWTRGKEAEIKDIKEYFTKKCEGK